eukprot:Selendium_serpulae@DN5931_c0_g1_i1.p1
MSFEVQEYMAPSLEEIQDLHRETQQATKKVISVADHHRDGPSKSTSPQAGRMKSLESAAKSRNRRSSVHNMERDVLAKMAKLICEKKQDLWWCFWNQDEKKTGKITPAQWRESCLSCLSDKLPYMNLQKRMKVVNAADGMVHYNDFLGRFRVEFRPKQAAHENWRHDCIQKVFESIMQADLSLKETLMVFDRNCDGTVSYRDFSELLTELDLGMSEPQVRLLMRLITASHLQEGDPNARIDAAEFLGRFKVVYGNATKENSKGEKEEWIQQALQAIGKQILADRNEAAGRHYEQQEPISAPEVQNRRRSSAIRAVALFQKFKDFNEDSSNEGFLPYSDFVQAIRRLGLSQIEDELGWKLTEHQLIEIARSIDVTRSGKINYLEFLNAFHVVDSNSNTNLAEEIWSQICGTIFQHKSSIRRALRHFDPALTGNVDIDDFRAALMTLNSVLARSEAPLTEEQIESLACGIESDNDEMIAYEDFLESFFVVDTKANETEDAEPLDAAAMMEELQSRNQAASSSKKGAAAANVRGRR